MKWTKRNNITTYEFDTILENLARVREIDDIEEWLNPTKKHWIHPSKLENIEAVCERIKVAIENEERIGIHLDVDGDGLCSGAYMYHYLREFSITPFIFHNQRSQGHGVSVVADTIIDEKIDLLIVVDSSSNDVEGCKKLAESGIEVIVIDHHEIDTVNTYATIVNCQAGTYENKSLSGSAMVYKVCKIFDEMYGHNFADEFVDLATIGLIGDMMDMSVMENRYIAYKGLNNIKNKGVIALLDKSNVFWKNGISSIDVSYKISPVISASARFDKIELSVELLISDDDTRIKALVKELLALNDERKILSKKHFIKAREEINTTNMLLTHVDNDASGGIRGLIATEISKNYGKPTFVLAYKDGVYSGSARGVGNINLKSMCEESGLFEFATGHEQSFGVEFKEEKMPEIIKYFNSKLNDGDLEDSYIYDLEVHSANIDEIDLREISKFSKIVGQGFSEPVFLVKGLTPREHHTKKLGNHVRAVMGKGQDTVKVNCENNFAMMKFRTDENWGKDIEEEFYSSFDEIKVDAIGTLNLNVFYNFGTRQTERTKQVFVQDYKVNLEE